MPLGEHGNQDLPQHLLLTMNDPGELGGQFFIDPGQILGGPQVGRVG